ncbi:hypothetical protein BGZ83_010377 [Gryganskiella cystojenkinii]|nr:hypothetical protein BGZ83_010377 [Gryganskiella cystojenkinii]
MDHHQNPYRHSPQDYPDQDHHHHRPPVLFQSDDLDQDLSHHLSRSSSHHGNNANSTPNTSHPSTRHHSISQDRKRHDIVYNGEDERPVHVHSQSCQDSCPVQDIYTEMSYSRFSRGARTNLYGLVVVKELGSPSTYPSPKPAPTENLFAKESLIMEANSLVDASSSEMDRSGSSQSQISLQQPPVDSVPATPERSRPGSSLGSRAEEDAESSLLTKPSIFTPTGACMWAHLPGRYAMVAAGGSIKCILGLQESFEFPVSGLDQTGDNLEIVSMDAFERKGRRGCQLVVLVSIAKALDPAQFELRCYGANTFGKSIKELLLKLPNTKDIQSIPLTWAPTKIIHAPLEDDPFEMAILIGGSDSCVHFFVQDDRGMYEEQPIETHFSVLASFSYCEYCVLSLVIKDYPTCRIVAAGTQNGTLNVGIIPRDPSTFKLDRSKARSHTVVLFAPITTLAVFTSRVPADHRNYTQESSPEARPGVVEPKEEPGIHLLVTCAIEQAWVYSDINKYGLVNRSDLQECSYHDSIMAAHVMDADWDGRNEVMIGTYGRQVMVFKELSPSQVQPNHRPLHNYITPTSSNIPPPSMTAGAMMISISPASFPPQTHPLSSPHMSEPTSTSSAPPQAPQRPPSIALQWGMTWNRRFASPIYGILSADLNDDGLEELVITTLNGCSIFLPDPMTAKRRLGQAVDRMREIEEMKATLIRLRQENEELSKEKEEKEVREAQEAQAALEAKLAREVALAKAAKEEEERKNEVRRLALAQAKQEEEIREKEVKLEAQKEQARLDKEQQDKELQDKELQDKELQDRKQDEKEKAESKQQEPDRIESESIAHTEGPGRAEEEAEGKSGHQGLDQEQEEGGTEEENLPEASKSEHAIENAAEPIGERGVKDKDSVKPEVDATEGSNETRTGKHFEESSKLRTPDETREGVEDGEGDRKE